MINPKGKRKSSYIQSRDINGNIIYLDPITGKEVSRGVEQGTTQQASYPIKKQWMINQNVQKKHNERIKSGQSVMIRGKEVRVTPKQVQVYQSTDGRPQSMKDASKQSYEQDYKQQQLDKAVNQTTTALGNFSSYLFPSTYAGALVDKLEGRNSFSGSLIEGNNGLGSVGTNLVFDLASPLVLGKGFSLMTTLGKEAKPILNKVSNIAKPYRISKAIDKGVKENAVITAYNRNPATKDIGNLWDYQSYLDNVFPKSKVKDVLWHGSTSKNLQTISPEYIGTNTPIKKSVGMYLAPERYTAVGYGTRGDVYPVLLNTENPFITDQFFGGISKNGVNVTKISPEVKSTLLANNDAVIAPKRGEIAFFNPDNALILGSDVDVAGFRRFMSKPQITAENTAKAEQLVKVPNKNSLKGFNFNDLPQEKYIYNDKTGEFDVVAPKKEWIRKGEELTKEYFGEHLYDELVSKGFSPKDAAMVASTRYAGAIDARPGVLRNLGEHTFGESQLLNESKIQPIYNSRKHVKASLNDANTALEIVFHELGGHGSSFNIQYGQPLRINDTYFIRLMKILDHNEKLRPKLRPFYQAIKDGNFKLAETLAPKDGTLKGINGKIDYKQIQDFIKYMEKNQEYSARAIATNMGEHYGLRKNGWNIKQLRQFFTDESVDNLLKNVWNYGIPITVGGASTAILYPSTGLNYYKDGGKMNTLQLLKNGSGIHIKKENKGKFTDYCGGKVTSECISKGKHSSNPAIRKRATFAANARKWKHKYGGFVNGVSVLDSNSDAYKYVKKKIKKAADGSQLTIGQKIGNAINSPLGKLGIDVGQKLIGGIQDVTNRIKYNEHLQNWKKNYVNSQSLSDAERQKFYAQSVQNQQMNNPDGNVSDIVASHDAWKLEQQELQKRKKAAETQANQYITQMSLIDNNNQTGGNGFNFAGMATDILSGVLGNSKTQAITNPSSTYSQFKMPPVNFKVNMKL